MFLICIKGRFLFHDEESQKKNEISLRIVQEEVPRQINDYNSNVTFCFSSLTLCMLKTAENSKNSAICTLSLVGDWPTGVAQQCLPGRRLHQYLYLQNFVDNLGSLQSQFMSSRESTKVFPIAACPLNGWERGSLELGTCYTHMFP